MPLCTSAHLHWYTQTNVFINASSVLGRCSVRQPVQGARSGCLAVSAVLLRKACSAGSMAGKVAWNWVNVHFGQHQLAACDTTVCTAE